MTLDNDIQFSTDFQHPEIISEDVLADVLEIIQQRTAENISGSIGLAVSDLLHKIANYVLPSNNPRLAFAALFYAADIDLTYILNCENTETGVAKCIGVSKQAFNTQLQKVRRDFGLTHSGGIRYAVNKETYQNNARQIKNRY